MELQKLHPPEDEILNQYLVPAICKAAAVLGMVRVCLKEKKVLFPVKYIFITSPNCMCSLAQYSPRTKALQSLCAACWRRLFAAPTCPAAWEPCMACCMCWSATCLTTLPSNSSPQSPSTCCPTSGLSPSKCCWLFSPSSSLNGYKAAPFFGLFILNLDGDTSE